MKYVLGRAVTGAEAVANDDEEFKFLARDLYWKYGIENAVLFDTREQADAERKQIEAENEPLDADDPIPPIKVVAVADDVVEGWA